MACSSCGKSRGKVADPASHTRQTYSGRKHYNGASQSNYGTPKVRLSFGRGR